MHWVCDNLERPKSAKDIASERQIYGRTVYSGQVSLPVKEAQVYHSLLNLRSDMGISQDQSHHTILA